ncbi:MAG: transposase [Gemmatimonadales bacterium]
MIKALVRRDGLRLPSGNPEHTERKLAAQLMTAPAIGPVTAVAFVATLDCVTRFTSAHQVAAYLGLTPREYRLGRAAAAWPNQQDRQLADALLVG